MTHAHRDPLTAAIIEAAMCVHSALGSGLLESAYAACLAHELRSRGHKVVTEAPIPVLYHGLAIDVAYKADLIVDDRVIVELKTVTKLLPVHDAQLLSYLRLSGRPVGLLLNFHTSHLKDGIRRLVNGWRGG